MVLFGCVWSIRLARSCMILYEIIQFLRSCLVINCPRFGSQCHFSVLGSFVWSCMFLSFTFLRQWISAHALQIESGCYTCPVTLILDRKCKCCKDGLIDDEKHFILVCEIFKIKRQCFLNRFNVLNPNFGIMAYEEKLTFIRCPLPQTLQSVSQNF